MITDGAVTGQSSTPLSVDLLTQEEERHMAAVDGSLFCLTSEEWKEKAIAGQRRTGESEEVVWSNIVREHVKEVLEREGRKAVDERGHHGETVLHWALMMKRVEIVDALLDINLMGRENVFYLVNLVYEGHKYWGQHATHLAVILYDDDPTLLARLIRLGADVHTPRARGTMFQPGSHLYMGETVLSFAASMGHRRIVEYLIETVEVDPNSVDTGGNNVLHVLAYWGYRSDRTTTVDDAEDMEKGGPRGEAVVDLLWEGRERPSDSDRASVDDVSATYSEQDKAQNMTGENSRFSSDLAREKGKNRNDDIPNAPTFPTTTTTSFQDQQPRIERPKSLAGSILPHVHTHASLDPFKATGRFATSKKNLLSGIYTFLDLPINPYSVHITRPNPSPQQTNLYAHDISRKADDTLANNEGLTPFLVAVKQGRVKMVQAILESKAVLVWEYGPVCLARYCLSELDTFVDRETMNHKVGAVQIAVENKDIEIITMPIFQQLLQAKWRLYGLRVNLSRFFTHFIYMILLSLSIALLPNGIPFYTSDRNASRKTYDSALRLAVEIILVAVNVMTFLREVGQGLRWGKREKGFGSKHREVRIGLLVGFFAVVGFRIGEWNDWEVTALGLLAIVGWVSLLQFAKGSRRLGPLVVIFQRIVYGDLVRFLFLLSVFVIGFSQAIYLQMGPASAWYANEASLNLEDWSGMMVGLLWGIRYVYGDGEYDDIKLARQRTVATVLFMVAILILTILLLNIFVAMLNTTFSQVYAESERQWRLQYARLIMEIDERILTQYHRYPPSLQSARPITRIGVSRIAPILKPLTKIQWEYEDKCFKEGMNPYEGDRYLTRRLKALRKRRRERWHGGKDDDDMMESNVTGFVYDFLLEFHKDREIPIRMITSQDEDSVLYEATDKFWTEVKTTHISKH